MNLNQFTPTLVGIGGTIGTEVAEATTPQIIIAITTALIQIIHLFKSRKKRKNGNATNEG